MKQLLLPGWYAGEPRITLSGAAFRHLAVVRRMQEGDRLDAVDRRGARYCLRVERVGRGECEVSLAPRPGDRVTEGGGAPPRAGRVPITLLQCLPKGRKIDLIVRQATEAGVQRIVLLVSEHCVSRPSTDDHRAGRLERIAGEALEQSGGSTLPGIEGPRPFASIEGGDWGTALLLDENPGAGSSLHGLLAGRPRAVSLLVGPEGGLSAAEISRARAAGFHPVHFDTGVLRVETAATFALGAVMTILQERDEWRTGQD